MSNRWGKVTDFIFLGSKITADGDCSHEIKRCLFCLRKTMTNLDSMLKAKILPCQQWLGFFFQWSSMDVKVGL